MADRLARIFGTEEDKVNCPFYFKIGACRHGDTCTRLHNRPVLSQSILLPHLYDNPPAAVAFADGLKVPENALIDAIGHFEDFYEEVYMELAKYGELEELNVCDNIGEHMLGNVYVKYYNELHSDKALKGLNGRYYAGKQIKVEFSPVTDFNEARCRLYSEGSCDRGGYCNFMHLKHVDKELLKSLKKQMYREYPEYKDYKEKRKKALKIVKRTHRKSRSRSPSEEKQKSKSRRRRRSRSNSSSERDSRKKHKKSKHKSEDQTQQGDLRRQSSAERRAIIEAWNKEPPEDFPVVKSYPKNENLDPRQQGSKPTECDPLKQMFLQLTSFQPSMPSQL